MSDTFIATEQPDGTWNLDRQFEGGNLWGCATGLDAMQANAAAALLNGNEAWEFDITSDGVVRLVLFDPETAAHDAT